MDETWDAIVIGSGMGGLAAAGFLARVGKRKVLVLEKHSERGGQTHVFRRDGASWDVGLHYIGDLQPGTFERSLFDFLSGGGARLEPDDRRFRAFRLSGFLHSPSPPTRSATKNGSSSAFPDEADAIRRYFRDIRSAARWHVLGIQRQMAPRRWRSSSRRSGASGPRRPPRRPLNTSSAISARRSCRALLATQWGDYGLPPKESAFALHALVVEQLPERRLVPGRRRRAHRAHDRAGNRGGRRRDPSLSGGDRDPRRERARRRGEGDRPARRPSRSRSAIARRSSSPTSARRSPMSGCCRPTARSDGEPSHSAPPSPRSRAACRRSHSISAWRRRSRRSASRARTIWINTTLDHDDLDAHTAATLAGEPRHAYLSFPSAKSGDDRFHTAEIITMLRPEAFDAWRGTATGTARPGLRRTQGPHRRRGCCASPTAPFQASPPSSTYTELSTPLTVEHFTSHPAGRFYGLPGTPERYRSAALRRAYAGRRPLS